MHGLLNPSPINFWVVRHLAGKRCLAFCSEVFICWQIVPFRLFSNKWLAKSLNFVGILLSGAHNSSFFVSNYPLFRKGGLLLRSTLPHPLNLTLGGWSLKYCWWGGGHSNYLPKTSCALINSGRLLASKANCLVIFVWVFSVWRLFCWDPWGAVCLPLLSVVLRALVTVDVHWLTTKISLLL